LRQKEFALIILLTLIAVNLGVTMESELYKKVYQIIMKVYKKTILKRVTFTDADIVKIYLWAVLHDRPTRWACDKRNWPIYYRAKKLPDTSTMCRRLRTKGVQQLFKDVEEILKSENQTGLCSWIDAKGLQINHCSCDKQAGFGYTGGGMGKGYKLYAIANSTQGFEQWTIGPMNLDERKVAQNLIAKTTANGYLVGDGNYDVNALYDLANEKELKFIAPKHAGGLGHRKNSHHRLKMIDRLNSQFIKQIIQSRVGIEHMFGRLCSISFGLKPLPAWVRGLFRVENWVRAKIIFYNLWQNELAPRYV